MIRKVLAACLALMVCVTMTACGGSDSSSEEKTTLVVGMECNYAPFNWTVTEESDTTMPIENASGYADGYDVQIAKMIAEELGMDLQIKKIAWDGLQPALESGEIDMIIAGMTADEEREQGADFTTPYYESEMVMIVRADDALANATTLEDFSGKSVVGQISTTYDEVIDQIPGVNHVTPLKSYPEMINALQQNVVDGITAELPVATGAVEAIACVKAINENLVPPTINLDNQDEKVADLDYVPHKARKAEIHSALSNSFGFGGQNATIILKEV